jgi:ABC-2 type transport system permease protein
MSPLGLATQTQVFVGNYFWPIGILLLATALAVYAAYHLNARRDIDQGYFPDKPGPATAGNLLNSVYGFIWRLIRNTLIGWAIGLFLLGAVFGVVLGDVETILTEDIFFAQLVPYSPYHTQTELFAVMLNVLLAAFGAIPVLILMFKLRAEEKFYRTEKIFSTKATRKSYLLGYYIVALGASVLMPFLTMMGIWLFSIPVLNEPMSFANSISAMMVYVPALWVMLGVATFAVGAFPKKSAIIAWGFFGYAFLLVFFGDVLAFPNWLMNLSPFEVIPQIPVDEVNFAILTLLAVIGAAFSAVGFFFFGKRDIAP